MRHPTQELPVTTPTSSTDQDARHSPAEQFPRTPPVTSTASARDEEDVPSSIQRRYLETTAPPPHLSGINPAPALKQELAADTDVSTTARAAGPQSAPSTLGSTGPEPEVSPTKRRASPAATRRPTTPISFAAPPPRQDGKTPIVFAAPPPRQDGNPSRGLLIPDGHTSLYGAFGPSLTHSVTTLTPPRLLGYDLEDVQSFCIAVSQYEAYCQHSRIAPEPIWALLGEKLLVGASQFVLRRIGETIAPHGSVPTEHLPQWDAAVRTALFRYAALDTQRIDFNVTMLLQELKKGVKWDTNKRYISAFHSFETDYTYLCTRYRIDRYIAANKKLERRIVQTLVQNLQPTAWSAWVSTDLEWRDSYTVASFFSLLADGERDYRGYAISSAATSTKITKPSKDSTSGRTPTRNCRFCQLPHWDKDCPTKSGAPATSRHSARRIGEPKPPPGPCDCGEMHWRQDCPKKGSSAGPGGPAGAGGPSPAASGAAPKTPCRHCGGNHWNRDCTKPGLKARRADAAHISDGLLVYNGVSIPYCLDTGASVNYIATEHVTAW